MPLCKRPTEVRCRTSGKQQLAPPSDRRALPARSQLSQLARHRDALHADRFRQHIVKEYHMSLTMWIDESAVDTRSRRRCGHARRKRHPARPHLLALC